MLYAKFGTCEPDRQDLFLNGPVSFLTLRITRRYCRCYEVRTRKIGSPEPGKYVKSSPMPKQPPSKKYVTAKATKTWTG